MESTPVGRMRGIDVRLHWGVLLVVGLLAWSLAEVVFPEMERGHTVSAYWIVGLITACSLFVSILAHELGHAFAAAREGIVVDHIDLWFLGGIAELKTEPTTPLAALRIAALGPIVSLAIGAAAFAASFLLPGLAGAALDGGRIYQAWLWHRDGDYTAATRRTTALGILSGILLIVLGVVQTVLGGMLGGAWLMIIGLFIRDSARLKRAQLESLGPLDSVLVADIMTASPGIVHPDMTLDDFVTSVFFGGRHAAYPVGTGPSDIVGMITLNAVRAQHPDRVADLLVLDVMTPLAEVVATTPTHPIASVLALKERRQANRALVFDEHDTLVGIISPSDVARMVSVVEIASKTTDRGMPQREAAVTI